MIKINEEETYVEPTGHSITFDIDLTFEKDGVEYNKRISIKRSEEDFMGWLDYEYKIPEELNLTKDEEQIISTYLEERAEKEYEEINDINQNQE